MRLALAFVVVMVAACDQGARPPQQLRDAAVDAYVHPDAALLRITSTGQFVEHGLAFFDRFMALWNTEDCERIAAGIEQFMTSDRPLIDQLMAYSKQHPEAQKALTDAMQPRMSQLMEKLQPAFTKCVSHPRLMKALEGLQKLEERSDTAR